MAPPVRELGTLYEERRSVSASQPEGKKEALRDFFSRFATRIATAAGSFWAFIMAFAVILMWLVTGPLFHFSDTWQLVINTATTIVTFLMVFLIQHAQNRDTRILHMKLNELLGAMEGASNELIDIEEREQRDIDRMQQRVQQMARKAQGTSSHSVDETGMPPAEQRSS